MSTLTTKARNGLSANEFALPKEKKYPIQDKSHAINAKSRAQQQYDKGNIAKQTLNKIDVKANKVLKRNTLKG